MGKSKKTHISYIKGDKDGNTFFKAISAAKTKRLKDAQKKYKPKKKHSLEEVLEEENIHRLSVNGLAEGMGIVEPRLEASKEDLKNVIPMEVEDNKGFILHHSNVSPKMTAGAYKPLKTYFAQVQ